MPTNNQAIKPIEIFRPGDHTPSSGIPLSFTEADVAATAAAYDPVNHEAPLVVGHPRMDAPAYGWVKSLQFADGVLSAVPDEVEPEFAEMVNAGRFKRVSAAFYAPNSPGNPKPGVYYLRHVGFLGAHPPAIKGLKRPTFGGAEDDGIVTVEFSLASEVTTATLWRRLRDFLIGKFGMEEADKVLPDYTISGLEVAATLAVAEAAGEAGAVAGPGFAAPENATQAALAHLVEQVEFGARALSERDAELARLRAEADRGKTAARQAEADRFIDGLVREGRVLGVYKANLVEFMASLPDGPTIEFSQAGVEPAPMPMSEWFRTYLKTQPPVVTFGEVAKDEWESPTGEVTFAAARGQTVDREALALHQRAVAFQAANPGTSYTAAIKAVGGR